jgi:hypothetical protein
VDIVTLTYYAAICGVLSVAAPYLGNRLVRLAIGVSVGVIAAAILPMARAAMGGY